jgi:xanthine dehydrogenase accessory factor
MASGVIRRLFVCGYQVIALEQPNPTCIRRTVCFAEAVYEKEVSVEGVAAQFVSSVDEALASRNEFVPILIDPNAETLARLKPHTLIDARMLKTEADCSIDMAPIVIGLGPGFEAGQNCHAVVETNRGHNLGRVVYEGSAEKRTGVPASVDGIGAERVLRAPADGQFISSGRIGDLVRHRDPIGEVAGAVLLSPIDGAIRGLIRDGLEVSRGQKIGDIDPHGNPEHCYRISDKANAIAGGVLETVLVLEKSSW